jgi:lipoate-protein ligase A
MSTWKIIDTGPASAADNMALDIRLLSELSSEPQPILHLYSWSRPSATFGHFIDPDTLVKRDAAKAMGLDMARRPTGGGMIFHLTDFAFSVLIPATHASCSLNTLENYACVNRLVIDVVQSFLGQSCLVPSLLQSVPLSPDKLSGSFCMAKPTKYDVMLDGKKVGGAAQRRTRNGFLHQGSISLAMPDFDLLETLFLPGSQAVASMRTNTCVLLPKEANVEAGRHAIKDCFLRACQKEFRFNG